MQTAYNQRCAAHIVHTQWSREEPGVAGKRGQLPRPNGQFQCLANFLLKHEKQNQSPQLKRAHQK